MTGIGRVLCGCRIRGSGHFLLSELRSGGLKADTRSDGSLPIALQPLSLGPSRA